MLMVSQGWDAVSDLLIGSFADRTTTRFGRYRPWVAWSALPLGVAFVLAFTCPEWGPVGNLVWSCVTFNLLMLCYTANNIPYAALPNVMTDVPLERLRLMSWRFMLAMAAAFWVQTSTMAMVGRFGGANRSLGFTLTIGLYACVAVPLLWIAAAASRERHVHPPHVRRGIISEASRIVRHHEWIRLAVAACLLYICLALRGSTMLYYFQYYLSREDLFGRFNGVGMASVMAGIALANRWHAHSELGSSSERRCLWRHSLWEVWCWSTATRRRCYSSCTPYFKSSLVLPCRCYGQKSLRSPAPSPAKRTVMRPR